MSRSRSSSPKENFMNLKRLLFILLIGFGSGAGALAAENWQDKLRAELPQMGHRNWIVVADSAYPWQTSAGVETIVVDADQIDVLRVVLAAVAGAEHVRSQILLDKELTFVAEADAPGIGAYRA